MDTQESPLTPSQTCKCHLSWSAVTLPSNTLLNALISISLCLSALLFFWLFPNATDYHKLGTNVLSRNSSSEKSEIRCWLGQLLVKTLERRICFVALFSFKHEAALIHGHGHFLYHSRLLLRSSYLLLLTLILLPSPLRRALVTTLSHLENPG